MRLMLAVYLRYFAVNRATFSGGGTGSRLGGRRYAKITFAILTICIACDEAVHRRTNPAYARAGQNEPSSPGT
jgi:hypothetical protein